MTEVAPPTGPGYGFGLYVHWPYCTRICPYCDFNVYAAKSRQTGPLTDALIGDLTAHKVLLPEHPALQSIFFGGGTPSLMRPGEIERIIDMAADLFGLVPDIEISLEANPNDVSATGLESWAAAGINRLSLGIQSLQNDALQFLGRDHDRQTALKAVEVVQKIFPNHSLDFIYARPSQTAEAWATELGQVLSLGAPHLSLYELTIEARTAFGKRAARGDLLPLDEDIQADLYELTDQLCSDAGLSAYEISNYASAPQFQSRHNMIYWQSGDWIGIGPGAHGRVTLKGQRYAIEADKRPETYLLSQAPRLVPLDTLETLRELLAMGLRPLSGLDLQRFDGFAPLQLNTEALQSLAELKLISRTANKLALTPPGRLLADRITLELAP